MLGPSRQGSCVLGAWGSEKELIVAGLAVHLVTRLADGALVQPAQAVAADEVLRVVLAPRGGDAAAGDRAAAAVADGALPLVEVQLAVGPPLQLEEGPAAEATQALLGEGEGKAGRALGTPPLGASLPSHSPCTRSTRCARQPPGPTGSCPGQGAHSPGIWGQTWPGSPGGSMASHCAPGTLWGGDWDGHPPGDGSC